jgi:hypothetical protein
VVAQFYIKFLPGYARGAFTAVTLGDGIALEDGLRHHIRLLSALKPAEEVQQNLLKYLPAD